jgi:excisionase family DNA binding protein
MRETTATAARRQLATVDTVVERLGVSRYRVYELAREGLLPHVRIGKSVRFDMDRVEEWIEAGGAGQ